MPKNNKLVVVVGPTASGKSSLAVELARKFKGEIISADSRQVYKGMNIGTGKIIKKEMKGIPHYLLNVVSPKKKFDVTQYRKLALKAIDKVQKSGRTPILCGGTGFYIQAVVDGIVFPEVKPDWKLRARLEKLSTVKLFEKLKGADPQRAKTIDRNNRRRLIRALEIIIKTKRPVDKLEKNPLPYPIIFLGMKKEREKLKEMIEERFFSWLEQGFIKEVKKLRKSGISWKKLEGFGLNYKTAALYLQNKINYQQFVEQSLSELNKYAKRQMTWFKRDKRIHWIKKQPEAEKLVKNFLKNE